MDDRSRRDGGPAAGVSTILAPIRYPLTADSVRTLQVAAARAEELGATLIVLHISLYHEGRSPATPEIKRAINSILDSPPRAVYVQRGFFVEEIILEEAARLDADLIILGENKKPWWRRILGRFVGGPPEIASYVQENSDARVEVVD